MIWGIKRLGLLFLLCNTFVVAQHLETLAVLDFDGFGINKYEAQTLTDRLRNQAVAIGAYRIIERGAMDEILKEQGFQQSGCISNECIVEVGKLLGVKYMLGGTIGRVGNTFTISMRIIDVATGEIIKTANYDMTGEVDLLLTKGLREAAELIFETKKREPAIPAAVVIFSDPSGARVIIDNEERGKTPLSLSELEPNREYIIQVLMPNYVPAVKTVRLKPGANSAIQIKLEHEMGKLTVTGSPLGSRLIMGKDEIGEIPLNALRYPTGSYQLKAKMPGYFSEKRSLNIAGGQTKELTIHLRKKPKGRAFLFSLFIPGSGQLYLGFTGRGIVFLAAGLASGYLAHQGFQRFTTSRQQYETNLDLYNNEQDPDLFADRKAAVDQSFDTMKADEKQLINMVGIFGAVWTINLIEVVF